MLNVGKYNVRIVKNGDKYGRDFCLTHDNDKPMAEFYDARYPHSEFGQFVSRYYVGTLLGHEGFYGGQYKSGDGLCLDGGNRDEWSVSGDEMDIVRDYLKANT
jgi:hypothetical protein